MPPDEEDFGVVGVIGGVDEVVGGRTAGYGLLETVVVGVVGIGRSSCPVILIRVNISRSHVTMFCCVEKYYRTP